MADEEIEILGGKAIIYRRNGIWQFRRWLSDEKKYARKSLRTDQLSTAIQRAEDMCIELLANRQRGIKYFSITIKEGVQKYIEYRAKEVGLGDLGIVEGRLKTIEVHLNHFLNYINKDTKLKNLDENLLIQYTRDNYQTSYVLFRKSGKRPAADSTIRNEIATINACIAYLHDVEKAADIKRFNIPQLTKRKYDVDEEAIRRQTFTNDEYDAFVMAMRSYVARTKNALSNTEWLERELARHFFLFAANSGMRSGEQRQLQWHNVAIERDVVGNKQVWLANVYVPRETSKVRKARRFYCRRGDLLTKWQKICQIKQGYVFSIDGKSQTPKTFFNKHFRRIMALTNINVERQKQLVPYSLRHFMVTQRVMSGCTLTDVSNMCGTSVSEIEKTYYHLNDEAMRSAATADFIRRDGKIFRI